MEYEAPLVPVLLQNSLDFCFRNFYYIRKDENTREIITAIKKFKYGNVSEVNESPNLRQYLYCIVISGT